ncbi:MAG: type II secretion system protein [bacterium]|nr:type II secretion system protein [bacterium]
MLKLFSHKAIHKNHKGFTLIELLVVIAIIGILSSVVLASLNGARTKARDARRVAELKQIQVALELYYDANGKYPVALGQLVGSSGGASLSVLPKDPNGAAVNTTGGYKYAVNNGTTPTLYHIGATLEQGAGDTTLDDSDRDFDSATATWLSDVTTPEDSLPFNGADMVYDVTN